MTSSSGFPWSDIGTISQSDGFNQPIPFHFFANGVIYVAVCWGLFGIYSYLLRGKGLGKSAEKDNILINKLNSPQNSFQNWIIGLLLMPINVFSLFFITFFPYKKLILRSANTLDSNSASEMLLSTILYGTLFSLLFGYFFGSHLFHKPLFIIIALAGICTFFSGLYVNQYYPIVNGRVHWDASLCLGFQTTCGYESGAGWPLPFIDDSDGGSPLGDMGEISYFDWNNRPKPAPYMANLIIYSLIFYGIYRCLLTARNRFNKEKDPHLWD